jgi:hypothetical protein
MLRSIAIMVAALAVAVPASAQITVDDPAAPAPAQKLKDPNRIICEREEEIGSRLGGKKTCRTAKEWLEWRQQNRDQVEDWQRRLTQTGKQGG